MDLAVVLIGFAVLLLIEPALLWWRQARNGR